MLVVTTENVPGQRVREVKGQVFGVVVRSRGLAGSFLDPTSGDLVEVWEDPATGAREYRPGPPPERTSP